MVSPPQNQKKSFIFTAYYPFSHHSVLLFQTSPMECTHQQPYDFHPAKFLQKFTAQNRFSDHIQIFSNGIHPLTDLRLAPQEKMPSKIYCILSLLQHIQLIFVSSTMGCSQQWLHDFPLKKCLVKFTAHYLFAIFPCSITSHR